MNWSHRLLHDRRLLLLIILVVFVAGMSSAVVLPRMEDPILAKRGDYQHAAPGADATRVEALLTEKIEEQLREIEEIKELRSESRAGISTITVELLDSITRPDEVWSRVRGKIEDLLPQLPTQASRPEFEELDVRAFARIVSVVWLANSPPDYSGCAALPGNFRTACKRWRARNPFNGSETLGKKCSCESIHPEPLPWAFPPKTLPHSWRHSMPRMPPASYAGRD
ncbi:MAG: efflux RND transporter permease subunit [Planctomycetaceae bacterium]